MKFGVLEGKPVCTRITEMGEVGGLGEGWQKGHMGGRVPGTPWIVPDEGHLALRRWINVIKGTSNTNDSVLVLNLNIHFSMFI